MKRGQRPPCAASTLAADLSIVKDHQNRSSLTNKVQTFCSDQFTLIYYRKLMTIVKLRHLIFNFIPFNRTALFYNKKGQQESHTHQTHRIYKIQTYNDSTTLNVIVSISKTIFKCFSLTSGLLISINILIDICGYITST